MKRVQSTLGSVAQRMQAFTSQARYALAGLSGVAFLAVRAFEQQEDAVTALDAALEASGASVDTYSKRLQDQAAAIQKVTKLGDEEVLSAQAQALALGVNAASVAEVTHNAIGLAAVMRTDLVSAIKYATLASQGQTEMLARYIPALKTAQTEEAKQAAISAAVARGWALQEAAATTASGRIKQAINALGDTLEVLGAAIGPALGALAGGLKALQPTLQALLGAFPALTAAVLGLSVAGLGVVAFLPQLVAGFASLRVVLGAIQTAILATQARLLALLASVGTMTAIATAGFAAIAAAALYAYHAIEQAQAQLDRTLAESRDAAKLWQDIRQQTERLKSPDLNLEGQADALARLQDAYRQLAGQEAAAGRSANARNLSDKADEYAEALSRVNRELAARNAKASGEDVAEAFAKERAELEKQLDAVTLSKEAFAEKYRLAKGYSQAQADELAALDAVVAKQNEAVEAQKKLRDEAEATAKAAADWLAEIEATVEQLTKGVTADEQKLRDLENRGADPAELARIREALAKKAAAEARKSAEDEAKAIEERNRTTEETIALERQRAEELRKAGLISEETYAREMARLDELGKKQRELVAGQYEGLAETARRQQAAVYRAYERSLPNAQDPAAQRQAIGAAGEKQAGAAKAGADTLAKIYELLVRIGRSLPLVGTFGA